MNRSDKIYGPKRREPKINTKPTISESPSQRDSEVKPISTESTSEYFKATWEPKDYIIHQQKTIENLEQTIAQQEQRIQELEQALKEK